MDAALLDEERKQAQLSREGTVIEPKAEGTVRVLEGFRASVERGEPPLVPVGQAVAASLVGVAGARSLREGSRPMSMSELAVELLDEHWMQEAIAEVADFRVNTPEGWADYQY